MLKFVIVGLVLTTVSSAPLDSIPSEKANDSHTQIELVRPSPINPDIPMDPKPPERIILDDGNSELDSKSLTEKNPIVEHESHENLKIESSDNEHSGENRKEKNLSNEKVSEKSENSENEDKKSVRIEYNHDAVSDDHAPQTKAKESNESVKSDAPIIVYAVKPDEKQRSESFQTSHHIPNIEVSDRKFETSHHIPSHIDNERTKLIETSKVDPTEVN